MAQALDIERETYLAFLMDRSCSGPVIVGSPMGGMDIEEVAQKHPDAIHKVCVNHWLKNFSFCLMCFRLSYRVEV